MKELLRLSTGDAYRQEGVDTAYCAWVALFNFPILCRTWLVIQLRTDYGGCKIKRMVYSYATTANASFQGCTKRVASW